jgi:hypothetical protein
MLGKLIIAGTVGALFGAAVVATAAPELSLRGGRFKPPTYAELSPDQKTYVDKEIAAGRTPGAGGPFNIYLRSPEMADCRGRSPNICASNRRCRASSRRLPSC